MIDEKAFQSIKAQHESDSAHCARAGLEPMAASAKEAHAHRGWLLNAVEVLCGTPVVFTPTDAEVAASPVLAEVAGMSEREAVLLLAGKLAEDNEMLRLLRNDREDLASQLDALSRDVDYEAERARRAEQTAKPQRPRVGPWVEHAGQWLRIDDRGAEVGGISESIGGWMWWALRPFLPSTGSDPGKKCKTEEQARAAVDAVLATWAALDTAPSWPCVECGPLSACDGDHKSE